MTDLAPLTHTEAAELAEHEQVIEHGLKTFIEVGNALAAIRESRLYRTVHDTFEDYCRERWGFNDRRASQLITAAGLVSTIVETGLPAPANEGQARALTSVPEPDRADVWRETLDRTDGRPTAAAVRESAEVLEQRRKVAAEQRDARGHLLRVVELLDPVNGGSEFVASWADRLGPYDEELTALLQRARSALVTLDDLIEAAGR
jgi:hypothetical protein